MFSSTGKGAIQGNGYEFHKQGSISGPRILRLWDVTNFSVHDVTLVDSPSFHFSIDTCTNGEVYNMAIRGGNEGGLDGIDVWSNNIWVHDVMVTNKGQSRFCTTLRLTSTDLTICRRMCYSQKPFEEHPRRKHLLQLVWRLRYGFLRHRHRRLPHHLQKRLHLVQQPNVHAQIQRWLWLSL